MLFATRSHNAAFVAECDRREAALEPTGEYGEICEYPRQNLPALLLRILSGQIRADWRAFARFETFEATGRIGAGSRIERTNKPRPIVLKTALAGETVLMAGERSEGAVEKATLCYNVASMRPEYSRLHYGLKHGVENSFFEF